MTMLHGSILYDALGHIISHIAACIFRDVEHPRKKSESTSSLY